MSGFNPDQFQALFSEQELLAMRNDLKEEIMSDPRTVDTQWGAEGKTWSGKEDITKGEMLSLILEALHRINPTAYPFSQSDRSHTALYSEDRNHHNF